MPVFKTSGVELYYETHGSGPAIVFAHGAGGNHLAWYQQVPFFRDRYTCITFDHRGFGRSLDSRPVDQRPRFDEDLAVLIDHLQLPDVRLVAQSMGGWTCLGYAVTHPERVRALVMARYGRRTHRAGNRRRAREGTGAAWQPAAARGRPQPGLPSARPERLVPLRPDLRAQSAARAGARQRHSDEPPQRL